MVPAGSFRRLPAGRTITVHAFRGTLSNTSLALDILSLGANKFQFGAAVSPVDLTAAAQPIPVSLAIGNDNGTTAAKTITLH